VAGLVASDGPGGSASGVADGVAGGAASDRARGVAGSVDEVLDLYARWGDHRYDEDLSQHDHAAQTAACAVAAGASEALVAAALLHDVGHLLHLDDLAPGPDGRVVVRHEDDLLHESVGPHWLASLFGPEVLGPIELHVVAKRYLCAIDPEYHDGLSHGSRSSLARQGGPMTAAEAAAFAATPGATDATSLRRWDDAGKVEGLEVAPVATYRELLLRVARA
jgi:gamma-butyrobetaine dioxygenase